MARRRATVQYSECKLLGHAWDEYDPPAGHDRWAKNILTLRCVRCTTTRHDHFDGNGELVGRQYTYPNGYRDARDDKPSRAALRLMMVRR